LGASEEAARGVAAVWAAGGAVGTGAEAIYAGGFSHVVWPVVEL